jgi:flagellar export protein FliJ
MPQFTFRLASLLRMRCAQRDERRLELAQALRAEEILRQQREEIAGEIAHLRQQRATPAGTLNVDALLDAARHEFVLRSQQKLLEDQTVEVSAEIERRRQAVVAADQQVRVLEKLRETGEQRHRAEEQSREQGRLDEAAQRPAQSGGTLHAH